GVDESQYAKEQEMFDRIHEMRTRIITSRAFNGDRLIVAILFENTMNREIEGPGSDDYLWSVKGVVPFLKVDKGLAPEEDGVQLMKPIPDLDALLERARQKGIFGTKMRSVIKRANEKGIKAIVDQQFEIGRRILAAGFMPILEPEVDIHAPDKAEAEAILKRYLLEGLETLDEGQQVMFKLTLPDVDDFYRELIEHPRVLRVVALSGGYTRAEANAKLARNHGMVASFSRALTEGLHVSQSDEEFDKVLDESIQSIYEASLTNRRSARRPGSRGPGRFSFADRRPGPHPGASPSLARVAPRTTTKSPRSAVRPVVRPTDRAPGRPAGRSCDPGPQRSARTRGDGFIAKRTRFPCRARRTGHRGRNAPHPGAAPRDGAPASNPSSPPGVTRAGRSRRHPRMPDPAGRGAVRHGGGLRDVA